MKKHIVFLAFLLFAITSSPLTASQLASDKKAAKHKHQDKSCCCDMKSTKGDKKNDCSKTDTKKDEGKKEPETK